MKKIEKVKIILDEDERQIFENFVDLLSRIDVCLGEKGHLRRAFFDFQDEFDEVVEDW